MRAWATEGSTFPMDFCSYQKADSSDAIKRNLQSGIVTPIAEFGHKPAVGFELRITYSFSTGAKVGK